MGTLLDLYPTDIKDYIAKWHSLKDVRVELIGHSHAAPVKEDDSLLHQIMGDSAWLDIASRPSMLAMLMVVEHKSLTIPKTRAEIFEAHLSASLDYWYSDADAKNRATITMSEVRVFLALLALKISATSNQSIWSTR